MDQELKDALAQLTSTLKDLGTTWREELKELKEAIKANDQTEIRASLKELGLAAKTMPEVKEALKALETALREGTEMEELKGTESTPPTEATPPKNPPAQNPPADEEEEEGPQAPAPANPNGRPNKRGWVYV